MEGLSDVSNLVGSINGRLKIVVVTGSLNSAKSKVTKNLARKLTSEDKYPVYSNLKGDEFYMLKDLNNFRNGVVLLEEFHTLSRRLFDRILTNTLNKEVVIILNIFTLSQLPDKVRNLVKLHLKVTDKDYKVEVEDVSQDTVYTLIPNSCKKLVTN